MAQQRRRRGVTTQPHDSVVKRIFSQRKHAAGLLRAALEPEIVAVIRWSTLKTEKINFVDRGLRGRHADLFFSAQFRDAPEEERVYVRVLLEHQSSVDPLMIYRMGSTMWRRWEELVRDEPKRRTLPLIIPILIHHSATGWTAATAFQDVVSVPEGARIAARRYIPCFEMKLVDVSRDGSGGLVKQALTEVGRVVLWCLSVAWNTPRLEAEMDQLTEELNAIYATDDEIDALITLLSYLLATHPKVGAERMTEMLETTARKGQKAVYLDVLEELKRKGRAEGRVEGRVEGEARVLLKLLTARFGPVPAEAEARIRHATEPALERWSLRVLTAPTLEAVLSSAPAAKKTARRPPARQKVGSTK